MEIECLAGVRSGREIGGCTDSFSFVCFGVQNSFVRKAVGSPWLSL